MDLEISVERYRKNIERLAQKNEVAYEVMLTNWKEKYRRFDEITSQYGFSEELENFSKDEEKPFIALTINGSILVVSAPDQKKERNIRYLSIKIRTDESKNVPEIMYGNLQDDLYCDKGATFFDLLETSALIKIKTAEHFDWEKFNNDANNLTADITNIFEKIDQDTIIRTPETSKTEMECAGE